MSKFKVGDRVRVIANTSGHHRQIGEHGTIVEYSDDEHFKVEGDVTGSTAGHMGSNAVELLTEGGYAMTYQRKTYRLLKDMPGYKKGTLFQEQCDDGTQPYSVISEPGVDNYRRDGLRLEYSDRSIVEENPSWFVEVFHVSPQYQTREELDQWEAFKSRKKPRRKTRPIFSDKLVKEVMADVPKKRGRPVGSKNKPKAA